MLIDGERYFRFDAGHRRRGRIRRRDAERARHAAARCLPADPQQRAISPDAPQVTTAEPRRLRQLRPVRRAGRRPDQPRRDPRRRRVRLRAAWSRTRCSAGTTTIDARSCASTRPGRSTCRSGSQRCASATRSALGRLGTVRPLRRRAVRHQLLDPADAGDDAAAVRAGRGAWCPRRWTCSSTAGALRAKTCRPVRSRSTGCRP